MTFIIASLGSAIGLGNFWRFPYLCYKWGGGLFFIPYLIALFTCGLPMMLLEHSCGQLFQRGDIGVFAGINKRLYGVGLASVFSAFGITIYYTYLIAIACCYFVMSFVSPMPWSIQRTKAYQDVYCDDQMPPMDRVLERACPPVQQCSPTEMYITEEYFLKDLVTVYLLNEETGKCELYDTSDNIGASENQYT